MTDLISSLADSIVALINSKPQSPTKAEVEEVLRPFVEAQRMLVDADMLASYPSFLVKPGAITPLPDGADPLVHAMTYGSAFTKVQRHANGSITKELMPLPYKEPSPELMQLMERNTKALKDAMNTSVYGGPTVEDREKYWARVLNGQCPKHDDGQHSWHAYDKNGLFCEPGASWDVSNGARRCICGAIKA